MTPNKQTIITILLAVVAMTGQAKTFKTIKNPEAMACVNMSNGELKARVVTFRDTATTVHFTMEYPKGQSFQFVSSSYLMDEDGNRYPLHSAEGLKLNVGVGRPQAGVESAGRNPCSEDIILRGSMFPVYSISIVSLLTN